MSFDKYKTLEGGLKVNILPMDVSSPIHQKVLGEALREAVAFEAGVHDSNFEGARFNKIMKALKAKKIQAWFMLAGWENCIPKVMSAAIDFPTVITKWEDNQFKHYPAKYREDTSFLPPAVRALIAECPDNAAFPKNVGLGEYFEQETMRIMGSDDPSGQVYRGRIAEYSPHSKKMIKLMGEIGAQLGSKEAGGILELKEITPIMKSRWNVGVDTEALTDGLGKPLPHVFTVNWSSPDGKQRIVASFTDAISTFTGDPITRVQFTSNGSLPKETILKDVLSSLLIAGREEITDRKWGYDEEKQFAVQLLGLKSPIMRIHTHQEPAIGSALKLLGAEERRLGPHSMLPVFLDLETVSYDVVRSSLKKAQPHIVVRPANAANEPCFNIGLVA